jgi:hypothetical protein
VGSINNNLYAEELDATELQQDTINLRAATCEPSNRLSKRNLILYTKVLKYRDLYLPMIVSQPCRFLANPSGAGFLCQQKPAD